MNKNITKPLIIQFTPPETNPIIKKSERSLFVPVNTPWLEFNNRIVPFVNENTYDSVLVHVTDKVDRDMKGVASNLSFKINTLSGAGIKKGKPVLAYDTADKPFYLMNPNANDLKKAALYAPSDETIMGKYNSFGSDDAWQEHQDKIWRRMRDMMPLSKKADKFNRDHASQLKDPKRGLEDKDLEKFWSFRSKKALAPTVMGDDMVGMPSVEGRDYDGFTMTNINPDGTSKTKSLTVRSLMTVGGSGIMIPMANMNGHVNKHQIATDLTAWGSKLHFRASDGITVQRSEVFDKTTNTYTFNFTDGNPTKLKITDVAADDTITMQDAKGIFNIRPKAEIIGTLKERGYEIPEIIASVKAEQNGKYIWQAPGTMTGSDEVLKTVSPSNPGYIVAREPKNGETQYVVLVAEGALKGHIVAKYADVKDKNGKCFGDHIAGNKGLIVTQVPGVSEAYIKAALTIYNNDKYDIKGTYIAMDADGRENLNVARGIHNAYKYINEVNPTKVLSWDPSQKGMDDALLAVAQGKITIEDMKLVSGTPKALFPLENAHPMVPYKLDGSRGKMPAWQYEYEESKKARIDKIAVAQKATAERGTKWVQTPENVENIQNITIAKAAEVSKAMDGKMDSPKTESRIPPTPDIDGAFVEPVSKTEKSEVEETIGDKIRTLANKWDRENPPMPAAKVPETCKSIYKYKQPVIDVGTALPNFPGDTDYQAEGKWGIVTVSINHEMTMEEKKERQDALKKDGYEPVGNMRLTEQVLTLDKGKALIQEQDGGLTP